MQLGMAHYSISVLEIRSSAGCIRDTVQCRVYQRYDAVQG